MHRSLKNKTNEEIENHLKGRTITVSRPLAQAEERIKQSGTIEVHNNEAGELCVRLMTAKGWRFIRIADIKSISRK